MPSHLYRGQGGPEQSERALIVLPEIFGLNKFIKSTTDRLSRELGIKTYALDHFFAASGESKVFPYDDHEGPFKTMQSLTNDQFMQLLTATIDQIKTDDPSVKDFNIVGFCFGGKLAFLAGTDQRITRIVSFYGSGGHETAAELAKKRQGDARLKVLGIFGLEDPSIPAESRDETAERLKSAGINYRQVTFPAGHAFMNFERSNMYNESAANQAWPEMISFLKN